jgi:hypothetical protein
MYDVSNLRVPNQLSISYANKQLELVTSTFFLGFILDNKLNWSDHLHFLHNKLSRSVGVFCKLRHYVPISILRQVYYALIHSHISYGISLWGNAPDIYLNPARMLQKKVLRIMTFSSFTHSSKSLAFELSVLLIDEMYALQCVLFMHKIVNNSCPPSICALYSNVHSIHHHNTRFSTHRFFVHNVRFSSTPNSFCLSATAMWNKLQSNVQAESNYDNFLRVVKLQLLNTYSQ